MKRPAVFLDRDGVINRAVVRDGIPHPPASLADFAILPGVPQALDALQARGYRIVVVTNQPDVARGTVSRELVGTFHQTLKSQLNIDAIFTCLHDTADGCDCRKPKPGLLIRAAEALEIDLSSSFMIGDRWRDMEAGRRAGCRTLFVDCGYRETAPTYCDVRIGSLVEASRIILAPADHR
jgi:D-glycero-D-manno-heptose 1,7-bisphosphate phosphatase